MRPTSRAFSSNGASEAGYPDEGPLSLATHHPKCRHDTISTASWANLRVNVATVTPHKTT